MKITSVRADLLSYPLPEPLKLPYYGGERTIIKRDAMIIRVELENGLRGYAPGQGTEVSKERIDTVVAPFLQGRLLSDPDALRVHFQDGPGKGDPETQKVYATVEIALYDLLGKLKDLPVSELLGGRVRDHIRLYGSAGMFMAPQDYAREALAISNLGFRAYKMRASGPPDKDLEAVRLMRDAVGPDFDLMMDAGAWWRMGHRNYVSSTIDRLAEQLSDYNLAWLEEPLPPSDHEAYRRLKEMDLIPIAGGQHEPNELRYMDLIVTGSVDYVQMDVVGQGGYATARRILAEISRAGLRFAFHCSGTALEVVAAAHLGICWPESVVEWLEYPCYSTPSRAGMYPFPLAAEVLEEPLNIDHGDLIVPKQPGLGVEVDESVIKRYPWIPGAWSYYELRSPAEIHPMTGDHSAPWTAE